MLKASIIERERAGMYRLVFLNPYLSGSLLLPFSMSLVVLIFVVFFLVLDCWVFLLYTFCVFELRFLRF
jgi:hypothetical protein